jgi:hypothetical protein
MRGCPHFDRADTFRRLRGSAVELPDRDRHDPRAKARAVDEHAAIRQVIPTSAGQLPERRA